jgi:hypothetical protein
MAALTPPVRVAALQITAVPANAEFDDVTG